MCAQIVDLDGALARLRAGECVAIPTETVYGLAGDAGSEPALRKIFALKGRPLTNPLIVHLRGIEDVDAWASEFPAPARDLAAAFWPGPLTMVLPARASVSRLVTAGGDSVALRVPAHPLTHELLDRFGGALCAPSANRSGYVSPTAARHVLADYAGEDVAVLDGGDCPRGIESTIVRPVGGVLEVLRPGAVSLEALRAHWCGPVVHVAKPEIAVPGSTPRHYAPRTPVRLADRAALLESAGGNDAVIARGALPGCRAAIVLELPREPEGYAGRLYSALRELDRQGHARILIERVPDDEHWLALANRLARAATPE